MREHLGEEFGGVVTAAAGFGIFVTLDAMYVEGLVHITELGGEYFRFDEARQELRGERTGIRYAIGTRVRVQVSRVDLDGRKIDFRLVHEGEELLGRAMKDKTGGHAAELPAQERGAPRNAGAKRAGKGAAKARAQPSARSRTPATVTPALQAATRQPTEHPSHRFRRSKRRSKSSRQCQSQAGKKAPPLRFSVKPSFHFFVEPDTLC
ncbi:S1 RNA-binding domain-containing protein [Polaromonas sp. P1-6]|nr:S1 RNA-binding domain-containing protein [Polaromonas sp. P1-6]